MSDSLSNGFLPQHARHIKPNLDATAFELFNRAVVITESSLWAMSTRNAGTLINTTLQVSNFGDADLVGSMVTWKVETVLGERVCHAEPAAIHTPVPVGANTQVGQAVCTLPRPKPGAPPVAVTLSAFILKPDGAVVAQNHWPNMLTVFPDFSLGPSPTPIYTGDAQSASSCPYSDCKPLPAGGAAKAGAVVFATEVSTDVAAAAQQGATVVLMASADAFTTASNAFDMSVWNCKRQNTSAVVNLQPISSA